MNPVIKFTTLFGLLAVELAVEVGKDNRPLTLALAGIFFVISAFFVWRSFYGMRIEGGLKSEASASTEAPTKAAA